MNLEELARKHALKNAAGHGGEADPGAVVGKIFSESEFSDKEEVVEAAQKAASQVNQLSTEEIRKEMENYSYSEKEKEHDPLPDLETDGEDVVVRFAPNPNGPPHLGHARGMIINAELKQKYGGKLILRYDDTDPVTKRPKEEAYEMYREDYEWLGYQIDEVRYSSKNFETYYSYAEQLIEKGKAYVSKASQEEMQELRRKGEASKYRKQSPEKNMELWKKMKNGGLKEGEAVLKVKTDLDHKNPAVRDFVAFRIIEEPDHPITSNKYRVWPMLDFQGAIEDHEMGTTHIIRGKDLRASTKRQKYIYDYFDWDYPRIRYWGTINVTGFNAPMSTSTITEKIQNGELNGWDDPCVGTLRALKRRGFQPEALKKFFIDQGLTENDVEASVQSLEKENTRIIDQDAERAFFVEDPVEIKLEDAPESLEAEIPMHPENPEMGVRTPEVNDRIVIDRSDLENGFKRLKGLCNVQLDGQEAEYRPGDHKKALEKDADFIHWLPADSPKTQVLMPDGTRNEGLVEDRAYQEGEIYQFERFGFVKREASGFIFTHE